MLRKINILIALTLLIIGGLEAQNHSDKIIANLQKPASNSVLVVSHRADWRNAPENSLQAIQNCIDITTVGKETVREFSDGIGEKQYGTYDA